VILGNYLTVNVKKIIVALFSIEVVMFNYTVDIGS